MTVTPNRFRNLSDDNLNDYADQLADELERRNTAAKVPRGGSAAVGTEERTYRRNGPHSFFRDMYTARQGDRAAADRLSRHQAETRDLDSSATTGGDFVPPVHLQQEWAALARAGRVYADAVRSVPLSAVGMSITVPKVTGGTTTATQAENTAVSDTDATTDEITVPVRTIAGQVDLSRQAFERSDPGLDEVLLGDLAASYAVSLDGQTINGTGSGTEVQGVLQNANINEVTFTAADPTAASLYPKVADAINQVHTGRFMAPDAIFMHPRRWAFFLAALDSSNRPLVTETAPQNAVGRFGAQVAEGIVGSLQGLPVFTDPNIPTNLGSGTDEDTIIVTRTMDHLLMESGLRTRVFESVGSNTLTIRLQVFGYVAYTSDRYGAATSKITGSGLVQPTF